MSNPLSIVRLLFLVLGLGWAQLAAAQETFAYPSVQWFTDQVLAPRADWYRPDLAQRHVRQLTRAFRGAGDEHGQLLGSRHEQLRPGRRAREVLTYNAAGYLTRYRLVLAPASVGRRAEQLENLFSYGPDQRLSRIDIRGARHLTSVMDLFSSAAYARWRGGAGNEAFRARYQLPYKSEQLNSDTWELRQLLLRYDAHGQARPARAVVGLSKWTNGRPSFAWTDTVPLDPRCDWHLLTADTLAGGADTAWQRVSDRWWQFRIPAGKAPGLRVQYLAGHQRFYYSMPVNEMLYGLTTFCDSAGRLVLARHLRTGTVWRYTYDAQGQPLSRETYLLNLPHRYGDTLYFGTVSGVTPIPDCEQRQRRACPGPMPDGAQAVREFQRAQRLRYATFRRGLPRRAIVQTTQPRYAVDVSFDHERPIARPTGHDGPSLYVKGWQRIIAQLNRGQELRKEGCVPMTLSTADTQIIRLRYRFFRD